MMVNLINLLKNYKNHKIALYGLSKETEKLLDELDDNYNIIGLLDGYREEGYLYDTPIIPLQYAVEEGVELIIVVARPGSCRVIANRIGKICQENRITLLDVRGNNLCWVKKNVYDFKEIEGLSKKKLCHSLEGKEVISFDIFDTLVMRKTLFATDVLEILECRLLQQGICIKNFSKRRLRSEQELAKLGSFKLVEIYQHMEAEEGFEGISAIELMELEWKIDVELMKPRNDMCELLKELIRQGKRVYLVSDTYYTSKQLTELMKQFAIEGYHEILASCDYGKGKTQGLFEILLQKEHVVDCIHIGDDIVADIESPNRYGIEAVHIYSGLELFEKTGYFSMSEEMQNLNNRIRLGMFVSVLFNSPFQFEYEECRISVRSSCDLGYLIFAPIICDFVLWLDKQVQEQKICTIWFCARDGYLIRILYEMLKRSTKVVYFITSRTAAIRAGIMNEEDIRYVATMPFSGSLDKMLWERFGICSSEVNLEKKQNAETVMVYAEYILNKARQCRNGYQKYMSTFQMQEETVAFFDFVSSGTSQMYINRFAKNKLKGFYFLRLEEEYEEKKNLDIQSFYQNTDKNNSCAIFEEYYILENILTAPVPSIKEINEEGEFSYNIETRTGNDLDCIHKIHEGIKAYFEDYLNICSFEEDCINKRMDETILSLIHKLDISETDFLDIKLEDAFFNRMSNVTDLV